MHRLPIYLSFLLTFGSTTSAFELDLKQKELSSEFGAYQLRELSVGERGKFSIWSTLCINEKKLFALADNRTTELTYGPYLEIQRLPDKKVSAIIYGGKGDKKTLATGEDLRDALETLALDLNSCKVIETVQGKTDFWKVETINGKSKLSELLEVAK